MSDYSEYELQLIKEDLWRLLESDIITDDDINYLLSQIKQGNIDGSLYYPPDETYCDVCLVGNLIHNHPELSIQSYLKHPEYADYRNFLTAKLGTRVSPGTPIEEYVNPIIPGIKPHHSEVLENIYSWIKEFQNGN